MKKSLKFIEGYPNQIKRKTDVYFSVDVETDGPIPGPYSMLSFAIVYAGCFDGQVFYKPPTYDHYFYNELKPISNQFEIEALQVNGLNRDRLSLEGGRPQEVMTAAAQWVFDRAMTGDPVFVAYPMGFDWQWMHWYFKQFSEIDSPFGYSRAFDMKTAIALVLNKTVSSVGRERIPAVLKSTKPHTHHALDDAVSQAEIFANIFRMSFADEP